MPSSSRVRRNALVLVWPTGQSACYVRMGARCWMLCASQGFETAQLGAITRLGMRAVLAITEGLAVFRTATMINEGMMCLSNPITPAVPSAWLTRATKNALRRYGRDACLRAAQANREGWGPSGAFYNMSIPGITSVRAMDCAMSAGHELVSVEEGMSRMTKASLILNGHKYQDNNQEGYVLNHA
jgi:hypothetical protein